MVLLMDASRAETGSKLVTAGAVEAQQPQQPHVCTVGTAGLPKEWVHRQLRGALTRLVLGLWQRTNRGRCSPFQLVE